MRALLAFLITADTLLLALYSYVNHLYTEKGRFLIRGSKDNVDFFEEHVEPKLKIGAQEAELTFPLLTHLSLVLLVVLVIAWNIGQPLQWSALLEAAVFVAFDVLFFAEVFPRALLARTAGTWLLRFTPLLRASILAIFPLVGITQFLRHFTTVDSEDESESEEPTAGENIEALMQAGEEEGLIEKEDTELIRSVVEFGDKTVREVMTPRPEIFAVPAETMLAELKQMLATRRYSRIPVYEGNLDHIVGFVHARDILPLADDELEQTTVRKLLRPITFVPETKSVSELLKEIQQKTQIAIVVDEYGSVAGLVTIEDMVEEIVGEIRDEHEMQDVIPQGERSFSVPGNMDVDRLHDLFGVRIEDAGEATTVSGLVTSTMGRVPASGEWIEKDGLVFRVTESNGRKVVRLLISADSHNQPVRSSASPAAGNPAQAS
ncbi:MAG: HlyC/CorC family transporter [Acidobacteria bacterium]|nr:HlyC/CorC family transporter [Acidobacteriota bacterium]